MTQQAQSRAGGNVSLAPAVWSDFFTAFRNHIAVADPVQEQPALDPVRAAQFFALGNHMLTTFSASGQAIPMWEIAGLKRDETRTCSVLAWLLDRYGSHGQGDAFLRCFLECVSGGFSVPAEALAKGYRTRVESIYDDLGEQMVRNLIDIEINGPGLLLFIEAKIDAGEGDNQLERYFGRLRATAGNRSCALIFLTPTGRLPKSCTAEQQEAIVAVSWDAVALRFMRHIDRKMPANSFGTVFIRQFCEHIANF